MKKTTAVEEQRPEGTRFDSVLDEVVRRGAKSMLMAALDAEVATFCRRHEDVRDESGHRLVVKNGFQKERTIVTGAGAIEVRVPRVDDRVPTEAGRPRFSSSLIPPYLRRTKNIEELVPLLYLKGISTGDFSEVLEKLTGQKVAGFSAETIVRLKQTWEQHYVEDGFRESKESWQSVLRDLKRRGLPRGPKLAIGDGALGFWAALAEEYNDTKTQLCWVHKTANALDKLPSSLQGKGKKMIHDIYLSPTKEEANKAFDEFVKEFELKYPKAVDSLRTNRDRLLSFYEFPAEHGPSIRSSNVIESTFATVRLRTKRTKGCGSRIATLTMVFKLAESAQKRWHKLRGYNVIPKVRAGARFEDGIEMEMAA